MPLVSFVVCKYVWKDWMAVKVDECTVLGLTFLLAC